MNQISPKVFEAIRLRTALVLFEGEYSGVVEPDVHFIPLKKDMSNIDEVFAKLEDREFLTALTDRAFRDIVESEKYTHRSFIAGIDREIETRKLRSRRHVILSSPSVALTGDGGSTRLGTADRNGFTLSDKPLIRGEHDRDLIAADLPAFVNHEDHQRVTAEHQRVTDELDLAVKQLAAKPLPAPPARMGRREALRVLLLPIWRRLPRWVRAFLRRPLRLGWKTVRKARR
jgi:hypothetical protein